jgi:bifunctional non-homologous end joining protein LigD
MALAEYKRKRDFKKTPEPAGKKAPKKGHSFVIQKHAATRLHYDFRLELDGVLKSWAVPKGPSLDPGEKRLAVQVEDHPVDYGGFEGIIPKGQYGGGTVLLWDRGTWELQGDDPAAAYRKGHLKFRLHGKKLHGGWNLVRMHGERAGENRENWLLIKENDETAVPGSGEAIVRERPESVASGQSIEEIAADPENVWESNRPEKAAGTFKEKVRRAAARAEEKTPKKTGRAVRAVRAAKAAKGKKGAEAEALGAFDLERIPGARQAALPAGGVEPELATLVDEAPRGEEWLHEIKYDGYRVLCEVDAGAVRLWTRHGKDWSDRFRPVAEAARRLPARQALLDGEVVVLEPDGTTSFQALQNSLSGGRDEDLVYFAFDLLYLDGYDLRRAALRDRKTVLAELLARVPAEGPLRFSEHVKGRGEDFYRHACSLALEGMVAKRAEAPYRSGRGKDWLKVKCLKRQEFVIVGYTDPEGARSGFGALLLAVQDEAEGGLVFAGKVGTGFTERTLADLKRRLSRRERQTPAFAKAPRGGLTKIGARRSHWVEPELVAEVAFTEWTKDGILRHPSFQGLREDKAPAEVVRERPQPAAGSAGPAGKKPRKAAPRGRPERKAKQRGKTATAPVRTAASRVAAPAVSAGSVAPAPPRGDRGGKGKETAIAGVRMTHPDKVLYPGQGLTKLDLARYYAAVADRILPHLGDRPLSLVRCPEGQGRQCFFQKHVGEQFPAVVQRVDVGEEEPYGAVDSLEGLLALVQMGVLELHIWGAHRDRIEQPDYIVFDLDPDEGLAWERVAQGARTVRDLLAELGLQTFLKTTGGKGLHVVAPLARRQGQGWDEVKAFTKSVAEAVTAAQPDLYTAKLPKVRRQGKIFIDYLRNGRGATSICAYSTRARPGAPVSTPLFWEELDDPKLRGNTYTVENLPARLEKLPSDPWEGFAKVRQSITAAMRKKLERKAP